MSKTLRLDVFGRQIIAKHIAGSWRLSMGGAEGKRRPLYDILVPDDVVSEEDLLTFLQDVYHESAKPAPKPAVKRKRKG